MPAPAVASEDVLRGLCHRSLRHVAVIRALPAMGDLLCAVPALRSIRRGSPSARVTLVGLAGAAWFVERFRWYVDDLLVLPRWPAVPEAGGTAQATLDLLASALPSFDLVVQLHGSGGPVNRLGPALGATLTIAHDRVPGRSSRLVARAWPEHGHESERLHDLVVWAGFPSAGVHLEFPELDGDGAMADVLLGQIGVPVVVLHPGASQPDRRWSAAGFAALADRLSAAGVVPVLTAGPTERALVEDVAGRCARRPVVAPPLSIGELAALLRRVDALVVNDTGVAHLGIAVGTTTVVVGAAADVDRWGPRDRFRHRAVGVTGRLDADVDTVWTAIRDVVRAARGPHTGTGSAMQMTS